MRYIYFKFPAKNLNFVNDGKKKGTFSKINFPGGQRVYVY